PGPGPRSRPPPPRRRLAPAQRRAPGTGESFATSTAHLGTNDTPSEKVGERASLARSPTFSIPVRLVDDVLQGLAGGKTLGIFAQDPELAVLDVGAGAGHVGR